MKRDNRTAILYQEWRSLLFLHWEVAPEVIQKRLPAGLEVDTFAGKAYMGIVPFHMRGLRPKFCPPCPGISYFPELNLRTYVRHRNGLNGVWFFSLDAHSRLSVLIARKLFGLPYHLAKVTYNLGPEHTVDFHSQRIGESTQSFTYRFGEETGKAKVGTLDHFLVERYRLFTIKDGKLKIGELFHTPYQLSKVDIKGYSKELFRLNKFTIPSTAPDHVTFSRGVRVEVYPFRTANT